MERVIAGSANHTYELHRNNWPLMVHTNEGPWRQGGWKRADISEFICLPFNCALYVPSLGEKQERKMLAGGKETTAREITQRKL